MDEYKGLYYKEKKEVRFFEAGAHFRYRDLVRELGSLCDSQRKEEQSKFIPKPKTRNVFQNENLNNINASLINRTNTYLIHKKNITYFHKSSLSSERGNNDIHRNVRESCVSNNNLCKAITLRKQNNNLIGKKIMFPNFNNSRNIRMKSVDYDSKLKWKNITEHQMNNDISSLSILKNSNIARSIDNPHNNNEYNYKYKKITLGTDKKIPNLYLKKKTGDFYLKNPTRNRNDINYNAISQRGISQSTIKRKIYINSILGRNIGNVGKV